MRRIIHTLCIGALAVMAVPSFGAQIVINEVYGGGGNSGSTYKNDFIELYNNGSSAVDISGYRVVYASAAAAFTTPGSDNTTSAFIPASTTLAAGAYYLIQEAVGAGGTTNLPSPNLIDATPIAMSGTTAKVRLTDSSGTVLDLVGWGTANAFEGTAVAPGTSNTTSAMRIPNGTDTDENSADFQIGFPTPGAVNEVPEPASMGALAIAGLLALPRRRNV